MKTAVFVVIFMLGMGNTALASEMGKLEELLKKEPENVKILLKLGIDYHHKGVEGDEKAVKEAEKVFKKVLWLEPDNVEVLAWYGSTLTLKGRDAWFPISKLRYVNQGIEKMNEAVKIAPDNITVRMIRANNSLGLPDFFDRLKFAITDSEYLLKLKKKSPKAFPDELLLQIYLNLGRAYQKKGETEKAKKYLNKVIKLAPESRKVKEVKKLLGQTE
ncbi:MAG: tetratricopeptide repeat protein [bacterium]|nr:tetratricopeptide repeat protein [bacterium]